MSTLTTTTGVLVPSAREVKSTVTRKPFWRLIFEAMITSRQRQADREIAAYVAGHGGPLTDEMEREIMRRVIGRTGFTG
jgi:hypothetical protein